MLLIMFFGKTNAFSVLVPRVTSTERSTREFKEKLSRARRDLTPSFNKTTDASPLLQAHLLSPLPSHS